MEMPGRKYASESSYRYGYQGQYAEKEGETSLHHFELRQWDARIARWNSTDPYGQYFSPYMGMGNNPISGVDPDGGFAGPGGSILLQEVLLLESVGGSSAFNLASILSSSIGNCAFGGFGTPPPFDIGLFPNSELLPTVDVYAYQNSASLKTDEFSYYGGSPMVPGKGSILKAIKNIPSLVKSLKNLPSLVKSLTSKTVLEGAVKSNFNRFVKKIPANSKSSANFKRLKDGNYLFEAASPGRVSGSKAVYQKWVNPQGDTFKMLKTTFGPDGKIIHIKPK
jgi:RHS repeat-associated protein